MAGEEFVEKFADDALSRLMENIESGKIKLDTSTPAEPKTVPLVIWVGEEKRIVGEATVIGNTVHGQVDEVDGAGLIQMITEGVVDGLAVSFKNSEPWQDKFPYGKATEKLLDHEVAQARRDREQLAEFTDKYPYGNAPE